MRALYFLRHCRVLFWCLTLCTNFLIKEAEKLPYFEFVKIPTASATYFKDYDLANYRNNQTNYIAAQNTCLPNNILQYTDDVNGDTITTDPGWICTDSINGDFSDGGETAGKNRTLGNIDNFSLGFLTNNQPRLHITNGGNVGIGTTTPYTDKYLTLGNGGQAPLFSTNGMYVDSPLGGGIFMGEADQSAQGKYEVWNGKMEVGTITNHPLELWTNNQIRMHITTGGQVGIGTTTVDPGLQLDINGKVGATEYCNDTGTVCYPITSLVDTNAATLCASSEYLDGDGNCYPIPGGGTPISYILDAYDNTGNEALTTTFNNLNIDTSRLIDSAFTLNNDIITFQQAGLYTITARISVRNINTSGATRGSMLMKAQKNTGSGFTDISGALCMDSIYEENSTNETSAFCNVTFTQSFNIGDTLQFLKQKTTTTTMQTVPQGSSVFIQFIR